VWEKSLLSNELIAIILLQATFTFSTSPLEAQIERAIHKLHLPCKPWLIIPRSLAPVVRHFTDINKWGRVHFGLAGWLTDSVRGWKSFASMAKADECLPGNLLTLAHFFNTKWKTVWSGSRINHSWGMAGLLPYYTAHHPKNRTRPIHECQQVAVYSLKEKQKKKEGRRQRNRRQDIATLMYQNRLKPEPSFGTHSPTYPILWHITTGVQQGERPAVDVFLCGMRG
jgi:hypothetical protein